MQKEIGWLLKEKYKTNEISNLPPLKLRQAKKDLKRLKKGEPLDYVIGFKEFLGCKINLSKKPLIPRPETEFWAERLIRDISRLEGNGAGARCLDLFCGSGCVGIAVLSKTGISLCDMADSQKKCLKQAEINCQINGIDKKRYRVIKSNVFSNIKGKYDFIVANPPYIPTKNKNKVQKSVLKYEPKQALFGGKDGMRFINKFLKEAKKHLNPNGKIFMEFDSIQKNQIEKLLKKYKYKKWEFNKDQFGKFRWVVIT